MRLPSRKKRKLRGEPTQIQLLRMVVSHFDSFKGTHPSLSLSGNRIPISSATPTSTERSRVPARVVHILTLSSVLSSVPFPLVALLLFVYPVVYLNPLPLCDTYTDTTLSIIYKYQLHRLRITFPPVHAVHTCCVIPTCLRALYLIHTLGACPSIPVLYPCLSLC